MSHPCGRSSEEVPGVPKNGRTLAVLGKMDAKKIRGPPGLDMNVQEFFIVLGHNVGGMLQPCVC